MDVLVNLGGGIADGLFQLNISSLDKVGTLPGRLAFQHRESISVLNNDVRGVEKIAWLVLTK